jgi:Dolichyl-phosphate-mannose-protein mannosyltransferase
MIHNRLSNFFIVAFGIAIFVYLIFRAILIPMTDDEYVSFHNFVSSDVWSIITYKPTEWRANNHILNTLFIKFSTAIFGVYDWAFRIHSVLSFLVCYFYTYKILKLFTSSNTRVFLYLLVFFLNPYLLDFYALARGYAMCIAFWCGATYFFFKYKNEAKTKYLAYHLAFLFLSIWSNFSVLYFFPLFGILFLHHSYNKKGYDALKHLLILITGYLVIIGIVAYPIFLSIKSKEVSGGTISIFQNSIISFIDYLIISNERMDRYLRYNKNWSWEEVVSMAILIAWIVMQVISLKILKKANRPSIHVDMLVLFFGNVLIVQALFYLFKAPYPLGRTALLFSFPFYFCFVIALEKIYLKFRPIAILLSMVVISLIWNFYWSFNMENTREWWREGDAKRVLSYLNSIKPKDKEITLAAESWQYFSLVFYGDTQYKGIIKVNWTPLNGNEKEEFLFAEAEYKTKVPKRYKPMKEFAHGILYKCDPCE